MQPTHREKGYSVPNPIGRYQLNREVGGFGPSERLFPLRFLLERLLLLAAMEFHRSFAHIA